MDPIEIVDRVGDRALVRVTEAANSSYVALDVTEDDETTTLHLDHRQVTLLIAALANARAALESGMRAA